MTGGKTTPHKERPSAEGARIVQSYLSPDASAALDILVAKYGTKRGAIEAALIGESKRLGRRK